MKKVYIIFEKDLKENRVEIYDVILDKNFAKRTVDKLNKQNAYNTEDEDFEYTLESYNVNENTEDEFYGI